MSTRDARVTDPRAGNGLGGRLRAYVALAKPRIVELLLITTVPAMIVADGGWPDTVLVLAVLAGGTLSAGGANAINNYLDRDIDVVMRRTARRPLPAELVAPGRALAFGLLLGAAGFVVLWWTANLLAGLLATGALAFYVVVYTALLKRSTVQNIVIGGAAGAAPVLVGWAAVTGGLDPAAWVMFAIVFYWTPPHFWALAVRYRKDYARAGVPMLPVVAGVEATARHVVVYSVLLAAVSLLLHPAAAMGWIYPAAALGLGAGFVAGAVRLIGDPEGAMRLFAYSNLYLALLFAAMALDALAAPGHAGGAAMFVVAAATAIAAQLAVLWREVRVARSVATDPGWSLLPTLLLVVLVVAVGARVL